jgi:hypothetical protein
MFPEKNIVSYHSITINIETEVETKNTNTYSYQVDRAIFAKL